MTYTKNVNPNRVRISIEWHYCVGVRETGKFLYRDAVFRASTRWEHMAIVTLGQRVRLRQVRDPPPSCRAPAVRIVGWRKSMLSLATLISRRAVAHGFTSLLYYFDIQNGTPLTEKLDSRSIISVRAFCFNQQSDDKEHNQCP